MMRRPCRSQAAVPHGATACTAIATMFGVWAADSDDVERLPFDEIVSVGALLWKSVHDRLAEKRPFLQTEEVLQHPAIQERLGSCETTCGSLIDGATADRSYSPYYACLAASIDKLREGNAGVFTFHEHSIGVARKGADRYYLFDSLGKSSTLVRFRSARELEDYVRRTYSVPSAGEDLSRAIERSRVPSADDDALLAERVNRHAFTFVVFDIK